MFNPLKQFVPSAVCLKCDGCCRFQAADSPWRPGVASEEISAAVYPAKGGNVFNDTTIDAGQKLRTIPFQQMSICYFLHTPNNTCGIYAQRPFECRLYPFMIIAQEGKYSLSVHLACPYVQENRHTPEFDHYVVGLKDFFAQKATKRFLSGYLRLNHCYPGAQNELEDLFAIDAESEP